MVYDVEFRREPISALFDLKGDRDTLARWAGGHLPPFPLSPNKVASAEGRSLFHVGRNHWILRSDLDQEEECAARLRPAEAPPQISIVRISDVFAFFAVTGPDAAAIMAIACPLDLHAVAFADDDAAFTEVFGLKALVRRLEDGFEFAVEQSYGDMVAAYLAKAVA
jgi:heterotetrameric sarcosine oxidase gamma subunit